MKPFLESFLKEKFDLKAEITPLSGYDDINFLVEVDGKPEYILKLTEDPDKIDLLKAEEEIFDLLEGSSDYSFPSFITGNDGHKFYILEDGTIFRLLSYVSGQFLAEADQSYDLLYHLGRFLGSMDNKLAGFRNTTIQARHYPWDLQYFDEYRNLLEYIELPERKKLVHYFLVQFDQHVRPVLPGIRKSIIHNDANDWNVLVAEDKIKGIIDFGDIVQTVTLAELAVACTYVAMDSEEPIQKILPVIKGYYDEMSITEPEISILYYLIASRLCISVCQSAHSKKKDPDNRYISIHEDKAWDLLEKWIGISPDYAEGSFRAICEIPRHSYHDKEKLKKERATYISSALSVSYDDPISMNAAAFQYMFGDQGRTYLDCVNNIMHVGHCHPEVVEAGYRQMARLNTNTRYYYDALTSYASELLEHFPPELNKVFFVNSGSAATDLALRLTRNFTGRKDMVVLEHGYHGNTATAIEVSHYKFAGKGGKGVEPHIHVAPIPDIFKGRYRTDDPEAAQKYADLIDPFLDTSIAGFISESIVGCGGQVVLPDNYLKTVYEKVRKSGGLCIADEVQTGFGRVGSHFWAYEMIGVTPDLVILGKPMGNGHPLSAVVCRDEIARAFENGMEFFSSFGGNPVSCEIGKAVLKVIREENLQEHAFSVGNYLLDYVKQLKWKYPLIGDVRGSGLFLGIELVEDPKNRKPATEKAKTLINLMKKENILLSTDGPDNNVIKIKPPMCFTLENGRELINTLTKVLEKIV